MTHESDSDRARADGEALDWIIALQTRPVTKSCAFVSDNGVPPLR